MAEIVMPRLSDSMEEGTILTWMKAVGDEVAVGDELVEIETDKANMAYESDVAGTLTQVLAQEGDTLAIGSPIAIVGDPGDGAAPETSPTDTPADDSSSSVGDLPPSGYPQEGITPTPTPSAGVSVGERVKASPVARRIAADGDVDLTTLDDLFVRFVGLEDCAICTLLPSRVTSSGPGSDSGFRCASGECSATTGGISSGSGLDSGDRKLCSISSSVGNS